MKLTTFQKELCPRILWGQKLSVSPREFVGKMDPSKFIHKTTHLPEAALFLDFMGSKTLKQFPLGSL